MTNSLLIKLYLNYLPVVDPVISLPVVRRGVVVKYSVVVHSVVFEPFEVRKKKLK